MKHVKLAKAVLALVAASLAACSSSSSAQQPAAPEAVAEQAEATPVPGAIVVDFKDGTTEAQFDEWEDGWAVDLEFNSEQGRRTGVTLATEVADVQAALERIRQHPAVESAEPLYAYSVPPQPRMLLGSEPLGSGQDSEGFKPNDPDYPKQWNLRMINMPHAWQMSRGRGVVVAVLDTGVAYEDHDDFVQVPDLKGIKFTKGYDFVNDDEHANDDHGHGTHVAGTIAQATNNGEGVAGVAFEATVMPVKVLNHFGSGHTADIAEAIRFAADNGAQVINMSLGGGMYSSVMASAVEYARNKGVTVVAAAGNTGHGRVQYPAAYPGAIAVSSVGPSGKLAPYSSYGKELDIAAPGGDKRQGEQGGILQNTIDPRDPSKSVYAAYQGTSMAAPHVAAVAALLYARGASSPEQVEKALYAGARRVEGQEWSEQYGHGLLDAEASLRALGVGTRWASLWWALGLLALVLLTLRGRERPGFLNVLFNPTFFIPLVLATVGVFFARWLFSSATGVAGDVVDTAMLPLPDWQRIIFGRGRLAHPAFYSALIPLVASLLAIKFKDWRPVVGGLALGFAGMLAYSAWSGTPAIAWMPFKLLAMPWLVTNALVCLFIARSMIRRES